MIENVATIEEISKMSGMAIREIHALLSLS